MAIAIISFVETMENAKLWKNCLKNGKNLEFSLKLQKFQSFFIEIECKLNLKSAQIFCH